MHGGLDGASVPRLARGVRLKADRARGQWVLLAPERVLVPDDIALDVLRRLDGARPVAEIVTGLAEHYDAPEATIRRDVLTLLDDLARKGFVTA
jgi:pyrroloquinoline quinone biosynthesis protein D